jgi:hypothetical protein
MQKSTQAKHVIHAYLKYTPASGYMECSLCKMEPTQYASNVDLVTLATASCYQNNYHHKNNKNRNGNERLLMYMVDK